MTNGAREATAGLIGRYESPMVDAAQEKLLSEEGQLGKETRVDNQLAELFESAQEQEEQRLEDHQREVSESQKDACDL